MAVSLGHDGSIIKISLERWPDEAHNAMVEASDKRTQSVSNQVLNEMLESMESRAEELDFESQGFRQFFNRLYNEDRGVLPTDHDPIRANLISLSDKISQTTKKIMNPFN